MGGELGVPQLQGRIQGQRPGNVSDGDESVLAVHNLPFTLMQRVPPSRRGAGATNSDFEPSESAFAVARDAGVVQAVKSWNVPAGGCCAGLLSLALHSLFLPK